MCYSFKIYYYKTHDKVTLLKYDISLKRDPEDSWSHLKMAVAKLFNLDIRE